MMQQKKDVRKINKASIYTLLFFAVFIFSFFSPLGIFGQTKKAEAACTVTSAKFDPSGAQSDTAPNIWYTDAVRPPVALEIELQGCDNAHLKIVLRDLNSSQAQSFYTFPNNIPFTVKPGTAKVFINSQTGVTACNGIAGSLDCKYRLEIYNLDNNSLLLASDATGNPQNAHGTLSYECDGTCLTYHWNILEFTLKDASGNPLAKVIENAELQEDAKLILSTQAMVTAVKGEAAAIESKNALPFACGIGPKWLTSGTIGGCILILADLVYYLTSMLALLAANILDFFIGYSLDSNSYTSGFIVNGWQVVRDIVNIFFIFILLYAAIKIIIEGLGADTKKMLIHIIIVALLINFSLFMARVVIDSSNILARIFYNNIEISGNPKEKLSGSKSVSAALVDKFDPQAMILSAPETSDFRENVYLYILIIVLSIWVNITMFSVFLGVGLFFLGRVIGLWIVMIFAPFAFISLALPAKAQEVMGDWGWTKWLKNLTDMALMAPIFTFFLYLIILFFSNPASLFDLPDGASTTQTILVILIPFFLIIALLKKSKELTAKYAGDIGKQLVDSVGKAAGIAAMAIPVAGAVGGMAMKVGGKVAQGIGKVATTEKTRERWSQNLKSIERKGGLVGGIAKGVRGVGTATMEGRFEPRALMETGAGKFVGKWGGAAMGAAGNLAGKGLAEFGGDNTGARKAFAGLGQAPMAGLQGVMKSGTTMGTTLGLGKEATAGLGYMFDYKDAARRKEEAKAVALREQQKKEQMKQDIQGRMSGKDDEETLQDSINKRNDWKDKSDTLKEKSRPAVEALSQQVWNAKPEYQDAKKEKARRDANEKDFEEFKNSPIHGMQRSDIENTKLEQEAERVLAEKLANGTAGIAAVRPTDPMLATGWDREAQRIKDEAKAGMKNDASFQQSVDKEVKEQHMEELENRDFADYQGTPDYATERAEIEKGKIEKEIELELERRGLTNPPTDPRLVPGWEREVAETKVVVEQQVKHDADTQKNITEHTKTTWKENSDKEFDNYNKMETERKGEVEKELDKKVEDKYGKQPELHKTTGDANTAYMKEQVDKLKNGAKWEQDLAKELQKGLDAKERAVQDLEKAEQKKVVIDKMLNDIKQKAVATGGVAHTKSGGTATVNTLSNQDINDQIEANISAGKVEVADLRRDAGTKQRAHTALVTAGVPADDPRRVASKQAVINAQIAIDKKTNELKLMNGALDKEESLRAEIDQKNEKIKKINDAITGKDKEDK